MIEKVEVRTLKPHVDERGYLCEILRSDDDIFEKFGQCYVSLNYPGVIRAWTDGSASLTPTANPTLLKIPPGVLHGYKTIGTEPSLLLNFPTEVYNGAEPDEYRLPWNSEEIGYNWEIQFK